MKSTSMLRRAVFSLVTAAAAAFPIVGLTSSVEAALPPGYKPNGCTLSPDRGVVPVYYDFKNVCNRHDYCYDELWYGGGENGRARCDATFLSEMEAWCNNQYRGSLLTFPRSQCKGVAGVYYTAVRNLGRSYFNNPWKN
jgi:hypothetical protein